MKQISREDVTRRIWLHYFNRELRDMGVISQRDYLLMHTRIEARG